jgi:hypothetical protein
VFQVRALTLPIAVAAAAALATPAAAVDPGKASGTFAIDGTTTPLAFAVETRKENLFDDKKKDLVVVLTDKALGEAKPDDEVELSLRARRGELVALALRIDGVRLVNVAVSHKALKGVVVLPGAWFQYTAAKPGTGTLKLAKRDFDGHAYETTVEFAAAPPSAPRQTSAPAPTPKPAATASAPPLAPASTSNVDRKAAVPLLIQALMKRDEHQALEIVKMGVDPNGRDQSGVPVLNWAVMMCQPQVVKALVDAKADLKYERAPGMTILTEAGACPEAAKILRAAGAR